MEDFEVFWSFRIQDSGERIDKLLLLEHELDELKLFN